MQEGLLDLFLNFGLAGALGFLIGLERSMGAKQEQDFPLRDFIIIALIGAISAFVANLYDNAWLIALGFLGFLSLLLITYWADRQAKVADTGVTTEAAAIVTFFLGVLVIQNMQALAVALAITMLVILSYKTAINRFTSEIKTFEVEATVKFLIITFIVLPVLPHKTLDNLLAYEVGRVVTVEQSVDDVTFAPVPGQILESGDTLNLYGNDAFLGEIRLVDVAPDAVTGQFTGRGVQLQADTRVYAALAPMVVMHMLAALNPFKVWLIVVLVSFISFVGYILVKVLGSGAGVGLTGLIGGLASSTVTTLSFAKRSKEMPAWNQLFAVAILLASSVMFPRLLLQIGVFNQALMRAMALPILVTGGTGMLLAIIFWLRSKKKQTDVQGDASKEVSFDNPFSLKSAITFGLIFATILMVTRLAITYLGDAWLPVVAIVSGLTDADAIAFSVSDAQRSGLITLDWAAFNVVLGALSNTFMKLFLVLSLGHRELFKQLLVSVLLMGAVGIVTMLLYYDLDAIF